VLRGADIVAEMAASSYDSVVGIDDGTAVSGRGVWAALPSAATALFLWQLRHPAIRFSSPLVNFVIGSALAFVLPWGAARMLWSAGRRHWSRVIRVCIVALLIPYSLIALVGSAMSAFAFRGGHDLSFDRVAELPWDGTFVRLYRTDGGATTDYGIVVRHERGIVPGIMLVRTLDLFYPCASLDLAATGYGVRLEHKRSYCEAFSATHRDYALKRFVYF
jgi:hypothetical protein